MARSDYRPRRTASPTLFIVAAAACTLSAPPISHGQSDRDASMTRVPVVLEGGHETDPRDRGRPVVLIAAALGVPSNVFREAFTHVHPAPAGSRPSSQQVRKNKDALLKALEPYGVTNGRLAKSRITTAMCAGEASCGRQSRPPLTLSSRRDKLCASW